MNLIIIAGFLGAGKTTLILAMARALASQGGKRVAIVENEIGEIGIDHQYLQLEGLKVQEIQSGCICCSLSYDLVTTLQKLMESFEPDVIMIEPSGVANPERILEVVDSIPWEIARKKVVIVVDTTRFRGIMAILLPFVQGSFKVADVVALNKIDKVSAEALETVVQEIRNLVTHARIVSISAEQGLGFTELMEAVNE